MTRIFNIDLKKKFHIISTFVYPHKSNIERKTKLVQSKSNQIET